MKKKAYIGKLKMINTFECGNCESTEIGECGLCGGKFAFGDRVVCDESESIHRCVPCYKYDRAIGKIKEKWEDEVGKIGGCLPD